ncbi:NAD-dependent epimerase/dehydratase family protein [Rubrobacter marinus]|uniref:NAD-dependent epimerase/dehydratase family protein n=1 Tax=Rubrobacter marinus TaxID=2653852 RepID=A0A6G8Q2F8_9ACTN|nr:polysaccharide biosynthesis protein [Rubrobacter marinus]QIN80638.1 NAD-dependent epimerase/dehydratase family protein [Rubrobacter marinus]
MEKVLEGKRVMVTGGTGSLGKPLVRRILSGDLGNPASVTVFSRDEGKHHQMKADWRNEASATNDIFYHNFEELLEFRLGDVRDYQALVPAVRNAEIIFHAAALKQVPSCEYFPYEAVRTNVEGANNLVRAIRSNDTPVEKVVGISTDKACKPVNVMGMSKAIQERVLLEGNIGQKDVDFTCVRYGNVVSSRGSALPFFRDQIKHGGPVTLTTREMTRFLITLEQAVDVVFDSLLHSKRGEILVPHLPAVRMEDVAHAMIGDRNIEVKEIGIRPGEKVHELMVSFEESARTVERRGTFRESYYAIAPILPEIHDGAVEEAAIAGEYSSHHEVMDFEGVVELLKESGFIEKVGKVA